MVGSESGLSQEDQLNHLGHVILQERFGLPVGQTSALALTNDLIDILLVHAGKILSHCDPPLLNHESESKRKANPFLSGVRLPAASSRQKGEDRQIENAQRPQSPQPCCGESSKLFSKLLGRGEKIDCNPHFLR
jgi:hypothetical protein